MTSTNTILLIEDEPIIRLSTTSILEDAGYQVLEAIDASHALALLSAHPEVSLVLTDVQMPGVIDGLSLVEIINQDYPAIRSIVTSGRTGGNEARRSGAKAFLSKPYTAREVETAVRNVLIA